MAKVTKVELQIDLSAPVEEIAAVVNIMLDAHPGRQIDILEAVDHAIGEALAKLQAFDKQEE
ncbi:hypothetical protein [Paenibacillus sp. FSL R5-808]|jgi:hypothetical protein|uniref:hypothetical protein n=1 Tax=Paenibacillus sp. FSL R5-808 TaxID=1227076 RepID=UPI0003E21C80|nr:hypothetical protein [Paenibacillus sp. FSL R5-808]ETT33261.1 hypothetical protein C169_22735 [Paenibacillus sp. FSL R5-808]